MRRLRRFVHNLAAGFYPSYGETMSDDETTPAVDQTQPTPLTKEEAVKIAEKIALENAKRNAPPGVDPVAMADENHPKFGG